MDSDKARTTVLTLRLDERAMEHFEALRQQRFSPALNRVPAHMTIFHTLPASEEIAAVLRCAAEHTPAFTLQVTAVKFLGRGVAYALAAPEAMRLHTELTAAFDPYLSRQDRQGFRPHVVVQNKVSGEEAKRLFEQLSREFRPWEVQAVGLDWWDYLSGPWQLREHFRFG